MRTTVVPTPGTLFIPRPNEGTVSALPVAGNVSIPCGLSEGLPVGLQIIGRAFSESGILQAAHALERAIGFEGVPRP